MTPASDHATIRDVAREAAVSVASVSRVLNGHPGVRPALRERVEGVAARLGYVPHAGARNLSLARTGTIGVAVPDLHGEYYSELLRGMDRAAATAGRHLLLTVIHPAQGRGLEALNALRGMVDGLVVMAPQLDAATLAAGLPAAVPVVVLNSPGAGAALRIDNAGGAAAMVAHLAAQGARHVLHIAGPAGNLDAEERQRGTRAAAARLGLAVTVLPGDFTEAAGHAAAARVIAGEVAADAIFAANDMMAIGALVALKRARVAVPGAVMVAGFDDVPLARLVAPALTTASIDIAAFGATAVARLIAAIETGKAQAAQTVTPTLAIRESTTGSG